MVQPNFANILLHPPRYSEEGGVEIKMMVERSLIEKFNIKTQVDIHIIRCKENHGFNMMNAVLLIA